MKSSVRLAVRTCKAIALSLLCTAAVSASAQAAVITGGVTTVTFNPSTLSTLESLFTIGAVPPTMISTNGSGATMADFPIVGGDTSTGIIEHSGGLSLTGMSTPQGVGTQVVTENYVIDLNTDTLSGEVIANGGAPMLNVPLFDIGAGDMLTVDATLGADLSSIYGIPNLTGTEVGTAVVTPTAVPEPASWALLCFGLATVGALLRRRRAPDPLFAA